jgi:hypothetical protein
MATCTPVYGLAMVEGADRPCDFDEIQCAEIESVRDQIALIDDINTRTAVTTPMVKVGMTIPAVAGSDEQLTSSTSGIIRITFDSVFVDTDNMFSSDNPQQIVVNTPGMYGLFMSMDIASTAGSAQPGAMTGRVDLNPPAALLLPNSLAIMDNLSFFPGGVFYLGFAGGYPVSIPGSLLLPGMSFIINGVDTVLPIRIEFGAFWMGDLA